MSEMTQSQVPPGGDADPDPSTEIVPPAARTSVDPSRPEDDGGLTTTGTEPPEQESEREPDREMPAVSLPTQADHQGASGADAPASSDPMPDMAGGAPSSEH